MKDEEEEEEEGEAAWRTLLVCYKRSDQWGLASKLPEGQSSPEHSGVATETKNKKIHLTRGLILSIHKRSGVHESVESSAQGHKALACGRG